ncbi:MAG: porin [Hyphomicrobium sp.]
MPAVAADLGGNCCADLEERIAELEATTARKGNRKVSLEVSGQVNEAILFWDDGGESNAYVVTNDNSRSRFRFKGKAKINGEWEAGYLIELGVRSANSKRFTQDDDSGAGADPANVGLDLRDSAWFVKSKSLGGLTVGLTSTSTDSITEVNLTQTSSFAKYSDVEDTGLGLLLRSSVNGGLSNSGGAGISFRRLLGDGGDQPGEGEKRFNQVKYETPVVSGFSASASWGEDDFWDVGLRYAGEFAGFKLAAGIGYFEITDGPETKTECSARNGGQPIGEKCSQFGGSVSVLHDATGLFVNVGAGEKTDDVLDTTTRFAGTNADDKQTFWAIQAGIEKKFNEFGKTTIYGEYYDYNGGAINRRVDAADPINPLGANASIWNTGLQVYGAGIAQGFDNAALVVYLSYRHVEADLSVRQEIGGNASGAIGTAQLEDLDLVIGGAIIKF